jgi:hypothetical protein
MVDGDIKTITWTIDRVVDDAVSHIKEENKQKLREKIDKARGKST